MNDDASPSDAPALVVGIGASAGGLSAFKELLDPVPADTGMTFIIVQHLAPDHDSLLTELLRPATDLTVVPAQDGQRLEPGRVYVIQPHTALAVRGRSIVVEEPHDAPGRRLVIDRLFRSLAEELGTGAAGIVLSGAGTDGTAGLRELRAKGGLAIAQAPETAEQAAMPQSAIEGDAVDLVLPISDMPLALRRFLRLPPSARAGDGPLPDEDESWGGAGDGGSPTEPPHRVEDSQLHTVAKLLSDRLRFDLYGYRRGMIERRIVRRASLSGQDRMGDYVDLLARSPDELRRLMRDLLIGVTRFFRDPQAFETLRRRVLAPRIRDAPAGDSLRIWVPGCATGEEAYSLGIEVLDLIHANDKDLEVQIFATDVDRDALAIARAGIYPAAIRESLSQERLHTYFEPLPGRGFQVRGKLRDLINFAAHDVLADPPFSRMDLVSCRNLLIYLTPPAQRSVLQSLGFALHRGGHLFLGSSETVGPYRDWFSPVSKEDRIFAVVPSEAPTGAGPARVGHRRSADGSAPAVPPLAQRGQRREDVLRRSLLDMLAPPSLVVSAEDQITFVQGDLSPFVRIPEGIQSELYLADVVRPPLAPRARSVVRRCRGDGSEQVAEAALGHDGFPVVRITARPAGTLGRGTVVLSFDALASQSREDEGGDVPDDPGIVARLRRELEETKTDLAEALHDLAEKSDELRTARDQATIGNEELQSANEELESTMEELRSVNEELTTVNSQLKEKVEQLEHAHHDLSNFLASTKLATIFLDERLTIRRFTPAASALLQLDHADVGRRLDDVSRELFRHHLVEDAAAVLEDLSPSSRNVWTAHGHCFARAVLPYRTSDRRVAGVVITFDDVTDIECARIDREAATRRLELALQAARGGVFEQPVPIDDSAFFSDAWAGVLGYRRSELPGAEALPGWFRGRIHADDLERFDGDRSAFFTGRVARHGTEVRVRHRGGHDIWIQEVAEATGRDDAGRPTRLVGMMLDVTDRREVEERLRESEARFRGMTDALPLLVWVHDVAGQQVQVNQTFCDFFGVEPEEMAGSQWRTLVHQEDEAEYTRSFYEAVRERRPFHAEVRARRADGRWRWLESWGRPRFTPGGTFIGYIGSSADITERKEAERSLLEADRQKDQFLAMLGHELRNPLAAIQNAADLLPEGDGTDPALPRIRALLQRQSAHIGRLLDGLLDISRVVQGKIVLDVGSVELAGLCRRIVEEARGRDAAQGLDLVLDLPSDDDVIVRADEVRLVQVVDNLLSNAIKYTPPGGTVRLQVRRQGDQAVVTVTDTGVGIPADLLDRMFDVFHQGEQTLERADGGLGVGLALVRSLVELHGGTVEGRSEGIGHGAELVVRLPVAGPSHGVDELPRPPRPRSPPTPEHPLDVVVVEDNEDAAEMLRELLRRDGHSVRVAADGVAALTEIQERPPDAVVCDLGLPGSLTGYDVARVLRGRRDTAGLRLVALSGYGGPEDRERSRHAGFDMHLTKPVDAPTLRDVLTGGTASPTDAAW